MSEDNKDFEANSIDEILKEFQAKRDNKDLPGKRHIDEPLAPPKPHTDFSNEKSLQKEPEAGDFHRFYTACRIKGEERPVLLARLKLADTARSVLKNAMTLIGCTAPEKM